MKSAKKNISGKFSFSTGSKNKFTTNYCSSEVENISANRKNKFTGHKAIFLFFLGPLLFYPLSFCYFKLPYIYCLACPIKCAWGRVRGLALLAILGLNLKGNLFCARLCPCGIIQDWQYKVPAKKLHIPKWTHKLKYIMLILIAIAVLGVERYPALLILRNVLVYILILGFMFSFFKQRFWCSVLCPVGTLSNTTKKGQTLFGCRGIK